MKISNIMLSKWVKKYVNSLSIGLINYKRTQNKVKMPFYVHLCTLTTPNVHLIHFKNGIIRISTF